MTSGTFSPNDTKAFEQSRDRKGVPMGRGGPPKGMKAVWAW
jgi:hypothetical protein